MSLIEKLDFKRKFEENAAKNGLPKFSPGDKVQLNYNRIKNGPDYKRKRTDWKMFVGRHRNDVFTVEYDPKFGLSPSVVCLAEDKHDPKWYWPVADLLLISKNPKNKCN